jgi:hypothetical protein
MPEQERTSRAESTEAIGDNRQDNTNDMAAAQNASSPRTSSDGQTESSSRNQRSLADDLEDSLRARGNEGYGEVY